MKRLLLGLLLVVFVFKSSFSQTFSGLGGLIPDDGNSVSFSINVQGLNPSSIDSLYGLESVKINILHTYDADLEIALISPDGTQVMLSYANGGDGDNYWNTTFTDFAETSILNGAPPYSDSFRPQELLGNMNSGQDGNGTWQLYIYDMYNGDAGSLLGWNLTFSNHPCLPFNFTSSNLPIVVVNTNGQVIPDDPKIQVDFGIIDNGLGNRNHVSDPFAYSGFAGIELRGSSSQTFPKKSYGFETWDSTGNEMDTPLLGMPSESDWILNANYADKTLCRNALAYQAWRDMGHYATRYHFCELIINNEYQGIYILSEKIKRDPNRVDIAKLKSDQNSGDQLTGGYIIKIDKITGSGGDGWTSNFLPPNHSYGQTIFYQYEYPKSDDVTEPQKRYIQAYVDTFETVLASPSFADTAVGFRKYAVEETFIDYFIVNEISKNVDGYRLSTFLHKERDSHGGKLRMGPVWDYDIAWHNANYCDGDTYAGWAYQFPCTDDLWQMPFWWNRLLEDTLFVNNLKCRWEYLRGTNLSNNSIYLYIDSIANLLNESQQRNFEVWPILGVYVWPNPEPVPQTYTEEIQSLKDWIDQRLNWLDNEMPGICTSTSVADLRGESKEVTIYPNPAMDVLNMEFKTGKNTSCTIWLTNAVGNYVFPAFDLKLPAGNQKIQLNLAGVSPGIYFLRIQSDEFQCVKKVIVGGR